MNACSCRTLILACIVYRQARKISRIAVATDFPFDPGLIARISPISGKTSFFATRSGSTPPGRESGVPGGYFRTNLLHTLTGATYPSRPIFSAPRPGFADPLPSPGSAPPQEANLRYRAREKGNPSPDCPSLRLFRDKLQECLGINSTAELPRKVPAGTGLN